MSRIEESQEKEKGVGLVLGPNSTPFSGEVKLSRDLSLRIERLALFEHSVCVQHEEGKAKKVGARPSTGIGH